MKAHSTKPSNILTWALLAAGVLLLVLIDQPFASHRLGPLHTPILIVIAVIETWFGVQAMLAERRKKYPQGEPRAAAWRLALLTFLLAGALAWLWLAIRSSLSPGQ